ncbi:penicillin-binding transpeptidase domain-containing protein [Thermoactinospora rubra]|uniref:penicillin-binding transpeptidase domain-containing protein n=1 Tax=Thermoactinospora rubra TaxID=1088767 RepID=UPI000A100195|nr:penicillin-binding transpeptidase domain-containing protein [Thermoactinospora rubra]
MAGARARRLNVPLRRVAAACAVSLFLLLANVTCLQSFRDDELTSDPRNRRALIARFDRPRGDIRAHGGTVLATSVKTGGTFAYRREYPGGEPYAAVTGHLSLYGAAGLERAEDADLSGSDPKVRVSSLVGVGAARGADLTLTVRERVQRAAYDGLRAAGRPGAAVAVEPVTGAILALVSYPSYDPGGYAVLDSARLAETDARLRGDPAEPLLSRALSRTYAPGSAFKVVTAAAALSSGEYVPGTPVPAPDRLPLPGSEEIVENGEPCGDGRPSLAGALALACDTAFASIGLDLGQDVLRDQAEAFGFNAEDLTVPLPVAASVFPPDLDRARTALSAVGRDGDRVTPMMLAMVAAAVANDGVLMRPYLVEEVRLAGRVLRRAQPGEYRTAMAVETARDLTAMMVVATRPGGAAEAVALPGVAVAGYGGTARDASDDAAFTAFAPADAPEIAVGVLVEDAAPAAESAAPIARAMLQAALE